MVEKLPETRVTTPEDHGQVPEADIADILNKLGVKKPTMLEIMGRLPAALLEKIGLE